MENVNPENPLVPPAEATHADKKVVAPTLGKVVEQVEQGAKKQRFVETKLRRRFIGKFEVASSEKPEKPTPAPVKVEVAKAEIAPSAPEKQELPKPASAEAPLVEIPLSDVRGPVEAFIDLKRDAVATELYEAKPATSAQAEAAADATLLGAASEQLAQAAPETTFTEAIDKAEGQAREALAYPTEVPAVEMPTTTAPNEFVRSYLERREESVRSVAHEQFTQQNKVPEYSQAFRLPDVLAYAEHIVVDGVSLRAMFESKQINETALRRLTEEYLRGGDVKQALQQELLLKEMAFERDPQLRDRLAASYASVDAASPAASQEQLAKMYANPAPNPTAQQAPAVANQSAEEALDAHHSLVHRLFITTWIAVVLALSTVAAWLILR